MNRALPSLLIVLLGGVAPLAQEPPAQEPPAKEAAAEPAEAVAETPDPVPGDLLDAAIAKAKAEDKMLFVAYGWDRCGNCRNLDRLIEGGKVVVPGDEFVRVEVHPVQGQDRVKFANYYGIKSGIYPRVVITDSDNKVLASRTGYGAAQQYNDLLAEARGKLAPADKKE